MDTNEYYNEVLKLMYAVGVDVSKGKSMVVVISPGNKLVMKATEYRHNRSSMDALTDVLLKFGPDVRIAMEQTGVYHYPIAKHLQEKGFRVSAVNPKLIHDFNTGITLRSIKTDKADARKIARYALDNWDNLPQYKDMDTIRNQLKTLNHQYALHSKIQTALKNSFISILEQTFPGINELFTSPVREDGSQKWIDFTAKFWHVDCVKDLTLEAFTKQYQDFCKLNGYNFRTGDSERIYTFAQECICSFPKDENTKLIAKNSYEALITATKSAAAIRAQMLELAKMLPEFEVVMNMGGVGPTLGPQLMAELGDVTKFASRGSIVAFAGVDPRPKKDSGTVERVSNRASKTGSPYLRRTLFLIMNSLIQAKPEDDPVYRFMDKKRGEGKKYLVYMTAGMNKFLRIYYARVKECIAKQEAAKSSDCQA